MQCPGNLGLSIAVTSTTTWTLMSVWMFGFIKVVSFICDTLSQKHTMTMFILCHSIIERVHQDTYLKGIFQLKSFQLFMFFFPLSSQVTVFIHCLKGNLS